MNTLLNDFDHAHVLSTLVETAREEGYTIRQVKKPTYEGSHQGATKYYYERYSARNDERGIKYAFELTLTSVSSRITGKIIKIDKKARDHRGRFLRSTRDQLSITDRTDHNNWFGHKNGTWRTWLGAAVNAIKQARGKTITEPQIKSTNDLASFPPLKFNKPAYEWGVPSCGGPPAYSLRCFYKSCRVRGVATILPNLKVSVDEACQPGANPWFYVVGECLAKRSGAQPEIIVSEKDGVLVFYPVRNNRVTNNLKPLNTHIDYSQITELDAVLVEKAIAKFLESIG
jgi:hypothetical protein